MYDFKLHKLYKIICNLTLNYTRYVSIYSLASLVGTPIGVASSTVVLKIFLIIPGVKKFKSLTKEKWKEHDI